MWYYLPLLLPLLGGYIAYAKIKKDDPKKAKYCIILTIVFTIYLVIRVVLGIITRGQLFEPLGDLIPTIFTIWQVAWYGVLVIPLIQHFRFKKRKRLMNNS